MLCCLDLLSKFDPVFDIQYTPQNINPMINAPWLFAKKIIKTGNNQIEYIRVSPARRRYLSKIHRKIAENKNVSIYGRAAQ